MLFQVGIRFTVRPPLNDPLHPALLALKGLVIEAPSLEGAEHYADQIRLALERQGG